LKITSKLKKGSALLLMIQTRF